MPSKIDHISVCVCTYKRPRMLAKLLRKLQYQIIGKSVTYSIVIVDNDHAQSAKIIVTLFKDNSAVNIAYYTESEQNISLARNKAVENAKGDFIAFIDDDEFPAPNWLLNLFRAYNKFRAGGILSPVITYYEIEPPKWRVCGA